MRIKWTLILMLLALTLNAQVEDDDDPPCNAFTNEVQTISIPRDCFRVTNTANFHAYTITNAGTYRFVVESSSVFTVLHSFPFSIDFFDMREGETHDFYLPCNYTPYSIVFVDKAIVQIPVRRLPVGVFTLYSTFALQNTNTQWAANRTFTNHVEGSMCYAPLRRDIPMQFFKVE